MDNITYIQTIVYINGKECASTLTNDNLFATYPVGSCKPRIRLVQRFGHYKALKFVILCEYEIFDIVVDDSSTVTLYSSQMRKVMNVSEHAGIIIINHWAANVQISMNEFSGLISKDDLISLRNNSPIDLNPQKFCMYLAKRKFYKQMSDIYTNVLNILKDTIGVKDLIEIIFSYFIIDLKNYFDLKTQDRHADCWKYLIDKNNNELVKLLNKPEIEIDEIFDKITDDPYELLDYVA